MPQKDYKNCNQSIGNQLSTKSGLITEKCTFYFSQDLCYWSVLEPGHWTVQRQLGYLNTNYDAGDVNRDCYGHICIRKYAC